MKTLLILRHAKSSWKNLNLPDYDRPLNKRGKRDAPRMGRFAREQNLNPELIITSTAKRARKTAAKFAAACGYAGEIQPTNTLYLASVQDCISLLQHTPNKLERVMIVGHNPTFEDLVEHLTGAYEIMPTTALAHIQLPIARWKELTIETSGTLLNLWRPKELPPI